MKSNTSITPAHTCKQLDRVLRQLQDISDEIASIITDGDTRKRNFKWLLGVPINVAWAMWTTLDDIASHIAKFLTATEHSTWYCAISAQRGDDKAYATAIPDEQLIKLYKQIDKMINKFNTKKFAIAFVGETTIMGWWTVVVNNITCLQQYPFDGRYKTAVK